MDINYYKAFITVVDQEGFSQAAKILNLTQPAVSFQIQSLEKHYQVVLIDRSSYKFKLTEAGELFYKICKKILESEQKLFAQMSKYEKAIGGVLKLGASNIPGEYMLPKLLGRFMKENPDVKVSLEIGDSQDITEKILEHMIDLGFIGSRPDKGNLKVKKFDTDELIMIYPKDYRFKQLNSKLEVFCAEPFIIREEGSGTRKTLEEALKKKNKSLKDLNIVYEMGSTQATISAVEGGLGISVISKWALPEISSLSSISHKNITFLDLKRDLYIVYNPKTPLSNSQSQFIKFISRR